MLRFSYIKTYEGGRVGRYAVCASVFVQMDEGCKTGKAGYFLHENFSLDSESLVMHTYCMHRSLSFLSGTEISYRVHCTVVVVWVRHWRFGLMTKRSLHTFSAGVCLHDDSRRYLSWMG
jgi:hypothetical protein